MHSNTAAGAVEEERQRAAAVLSLSMHPCHRDSSADSHAQPLSLLPKPAARCPCASDLADSEGRP